MNLSAFLIVGTLLFAMGAYGVLSRRNAIAVLLGVELMLNAANLNFLAFWRYLSPAGTEAHVFVLIGITVAAAEAAVGLAIILNMYRDFGSIDVEKASELKG
jgi:NADH-quinone oxidoreductase subunit K